MNDRLHGGNRTLVDFSVNLNPVVKPRDIKRVLSSVAAAAMAYPEQRGERLVSIVAGACGVSPENIVLGNGSIELFYMLPAVVKPKRAFTLEPTFCEYGYVCDLNSIPLTRMAPAKEFGWDFKALKTTLKKGDMVFICNPNNPTGTLFLKKEILPLLETGAFIVIDEAFIDFSSDNQSLIKEAAKTENLLVIKSLTKIYSIAGLRVGFCAGHKNIIKRFDELLPLWNVNGIAIEAALSFLNTTGVLNMTRNFIEKEKRFIKSRLTKTAGIHLYDSFANFFLARSDNAPALKQFAASKGIALRDNGGFHGLDERYFRFAIKSRKDNILLIKVFEEFFGGRENRR
jgi:threonine-phosphate decarboxylase